MIRRSIMRAPILLAALALPLIVAGASVADGTPDPAQPEMSPVQIRVKVENIVLREHALNGIRNAAVEEFLARGRVTGGQAQSLRAVLSGRISSGRASVVDAVIITTMQNVPAQMQSTRTRLQPARPPESSVSVTPRLADGGIEADLDLTYGSQTLRDTVTVPDGTGAAFRLGAEKPGSLDRVVFVTLTRIDP
jgi:hypothetical protein